MKALAIFAMLLGAAFGFLHIVETGAGFTLVPKAGFTFADTFISVDDVIRRYNNRDLAEALRGNPQLDNLVHSLERQGLISSSNKSESETLSPRGSDADVPEHHSKATTPSTHPTPVEPNQEASSASKVITDNFDDNTIAGLLSILSEPSLHCPLDGACEIKRFTLEPIDINGDEKSEFIVTHRDYCGSGGCTTLLMAKADNTWTPLAGIFGSLSVMKVSTKGFRDIQRIQKSYRCSDCPFPWYMVAQTFSWTGREYVAKGGPKPFANYGDVKAAIFDASNAVGNTIYFDAEYRELGMRAGLPTMLIKVDTTTDLSLWNIYFDSSFNDAVRDLQAGQRVSILCKIKELSGYASQCDLVDMTIN